MSIWDKIKKPEFEEDEEMEQEEQAPAETVVTDSEGQVVMDLDAIEQISIADENADSVVDDDEDIIDF